MKSRKPKRIDPQLAEYVAQKLKMLRAERNYTQEYVQEKVQVNIPRSESGELQLTLVTLRILCLFYGVTLSEFFSDLEA